MSSEYSRASPERPAGVIDTCEPHDRDRNAAEKFENEDDIPGLSVVETSHPRDTISSRQWAIMLYGNLLLSMIGGYDTSNVANIQIPIYQAFGHIELLPWLSLSYSLTGVAIIPFVRKLTSFCDLKWMGLVACLLTCVASALAGAAPNIELVIVGRVLMALGAITMYQIILSYNVIFARPHELPGVQALVGASYAIGLISGPIVGGAFAENEHTTWRWAFYIVIPIVLTSSLLLVNYPSYRVSSEKSIRQHLKEVDWLGCMLWIGIFVLFGTATIFSGPTWDWNSGSAILVWTLFGLTMNAFLVQQCLCVFTTPERRAFPAYLFSDRSVALPSLCVLTTAIVYGLTLYYTPIYFAFNRGYGALASAVRLLPFLCVFIFSLFFSGVLLPRIRYYQLFFVVGASLMLVGTGGLHRMMTTQASEWSVMGFEAIIAAGSGMVWQISLPIASVVLPPHQRTDAVALLNMAQLGGIAIALAVSGAIYENVGFQNVDEVVSGSGLSEHDIRELLSGAASPVSTTVAPKMLAQIVDAVTIAIVDCFYLTIAASGICFTAACLMRFEALEFKRPKPKSED